MKFAKKLKPVSVFFVCILRFRKPINFFFDYSYNNKQMSTHKHLKLLTRTIQPFNSHDLIVNSPL